jgi:hypothetical protein
MGLRMSNSIWIFNWVLLNFQRVQNFERHFYLISKLAHIRKPWKFASNFSFPLYLDNGEINCR